MTSWVFIFSKFTPEALLFEALLIFLLCCGYTAFWVLRKRRYGSVDTSVPSGPVKAYLNDLIINSEQLRLQLFGLLAASNQSTDRLYRLVGMPGNLQIPGGASADPNFLNGTGPLEAKILEQQKALELLTAEKARLEKELAEAKAAAGGAEGAGQAGAVVAGKDDSGTIVRLQQRVHDLESKLAEYNVIEDDLANLKRLQQENNVLKATLTAKGIPIPDPTSTVPTSWPTSNKTEPEAAPPPSDSTPPAEDAAPAGDAFASLAGQVENSLQQASPTIAQDAAAEIAPAAPAEVPEPSPAEPISETPEPEVAAAPEAAQTTEPTPPESAAGADDASASPAPAKEENEKSEADLVAEFERMLKG